MDAPAFGQHAQSFDRVEDLTVQELVPQLGVEALAVAVLPRRAGLDVQRLCSCFGQPLPWVFRDELQPIAPHEALERKSWRKAANRIEGA